MELFKVAITLTCEGSQLSRCGTMLRSAGSCRAILIALLLAVVLSAGASANRALADDVSAGSSVPKSTEELLLQKLAAMEKRIKGLEGQVKQQKKANAPLAFSNAKPNNPSSGPYASAAASDGAPASGAPASPTSSSSKAILGLIDSPVSGLSMGAYGEIKFGSMQNPAANGQRQFGFDAARFVLLPTYAITPNIIFNAEIEFEHAGSGFALDDKLHGTAEIEQIFIDFKIADQFNWRAPGIDLVPIGYINQHHEPTQFYSVNRPELYNGLIPSTFRAPATSVYGRIADGLSYQFQINSSIEDYGDSFDNRTAAKTAPPFPTAYAAGIDGINALGFSRPPLGDFQQLSNAVAYSGRLDFAPSLVPGLATSVSAYFSPNTTPRGAHGDVGNLLGRSNLALFDAEFRYRVQGTGLELRGEYVEARFGNPANLRANNDGDPTNNVGKTMQGYSGEVAYHQSLGTILGSDWEVVPFYRYTHQNLQAAGFAGTDDNTPTGAGQKDYHTVGVAVFPSPKVVLKANYQKVISRQSGGAQSDSFLGGVGFFF